MGGPGSGSWYRWSKKALTMEQHRIDIRWMKRQGYMQPGVSGSLSWTSRGEQSGSIGFQMKENSMILSFRHKSQGNDWESVEQVILLDKTPCNYGSYRKWFLCPRCSKRIAILYGTGKYFLCRHCYGLTYESCQNGPLQRIFDRANKLKKKLGGQPGLAYPVPYRPKGMHRRTYNKIKAEIHRLEGAGEDGMEAKWGVLF